MDLKATEFIAQRITKNKIYTEEMLARTKRLAAKKYGSPTPPNSAVLASYRKLCAEKTINPDQRLEWLLRKRKIRSLSGVAVVSILTRPYPCGGKCLYCPAQAGVPKSYLDGEPAVMRALRYKYDPAKQIKARIAALEANGHATDKVDLRIIGGTWSYNPKWYQTWFVRKCFEACNQLSGGRRIKSERLETLQKINESAKYRIVGINIETRPDYIDAKEIIRLRRLGVTQVELGVQSIYDDVLSINKRGHGTDAVVAATKLLKDAGFKICYHIMPNLPGSTPAKDIKVFKELFSRPEFQPDHLKIYPCALVKEAPLYWIKDELRYRPYSAKELLRIIKAGKKYIPYYCRVQRVIRDIPANYIVKGGAAVSNLRQVIAREIKKEGWRCKCIRCREVKERYVPEEKILLFRQDYGASAGKEIFLSFENKNRTKLYSLLRLRIPSRHILKTGKNSSRPFFAVLANAALIREIHTYGQLQPLYRGQTPVNSPQHKGLGKKLIAEAEKITKNEFDLHKVAVISAVGTRNYYRKMGYKLRQTYMVKSLLVER